MILKILMDGIVNLLCLAFKGLEVASLPTDMISAVVSIMEYGNAVVGTDLMLVVFGSIMFWIGIKTTVGVLLFVWRLLPLT